MMKYYVWAFAVWMSLLLPCASQDAPQDKMQTMDRSKSSVLDLVFTINDFGGKVLDLEVKETPIEVRIDLAADVLFDFDKADILPKAQQTLAQAAQIIRDKAK